MYGILKKSNFFIIKINEFYYKHTKQWKRIFEYSVVVNKEYSNSWNHYSFEPYLQ